MLTQDLIKKGDLVERPNLWLNGNFQTLFKMTHCSLYNQPEPFAKRLLEQRPQQCPVRVRLLQAGLAYLCGVGPRPQGAGPRMCERLLFAWNFPKGVAMI